MSDLPNDKAPESATNTSEAPKSNQTAKETLPASPVEGKPPPRYPVIDCTFIKPNMLTFWCPHCCENHYHGAGNDGLSPLGGYLAGHRVSHCYERENYPHGYHLRVIEVRARGPERKRPNKNTVLSISDVREIVRRAGDIDRNLASINVVPSEDLGEQVDVLSRIIGVPIDGAILEWLAFDLAKIGYSRYGRFNRRIAWVQKIVLDVARGLPR